ncbi:hypothetical protein ACE103_28135 [Bradyrhizobium sp. ma5]|uniref:hypothetical protein n=1 Tax=Bradyrhizobium sp. ma5 TaxID=3344828 RepID=UPI0035D4A237
MPTKYKPVLEEVEAPWLDIWDHMFNGLLARRREILTALDFYSRHDLDAGSQTPLAEELVALGRLATALTKAAVASQTKPDGVLVAALEKIIDEPDPALLGTIGAELEWLLAGNYRRGAEEPGRFFLDIIGGEQIEATYVYGLPTRENFRAAAQRALGVVKARRSFGRPPNEAASILANELGPIFRASGARIRRGRRKEVRMRAGESVIFYAEGSKFHAFLDIVLTPLREFLAQRDLAPVTISTIVRLAIEKQGEANPISPTTSP